MRCESGPCESGMSPDCTGLAVHSHHRKMRSQGGTDEEANILHVCMPCHSVIHSGPEKSYNLGHLVKSWQQPEDVAVVTVNR